MLISLTALLLFPLFPKYAHGGNTLPPSSDTQGYVDNLIQSYNALVKSNYATNVNFAQIKANFTLYHDVGNTFRVIVMQGAPNSTTVMLVFVPIGGNDPVVILDSNDTFDQLSGIAVFSANVTLEHLTFGYANTIIYVSLALGTRFSDITGDYLTNSANSARWLFRYDQESISQSVITIPHPSLMDQFYNCIYSGICGAIGWAIGIVASILGVAGVLFVLRRRRRFPSKHSKQQMNRVSLFKKQK